MAAIGRAEAAGSVVTLECGEKGAAPDTVAPDTESMRVYGGKDIVLHHLLDIDYGAGTVHQYARLDDGSPVRVYTYPNGYFLTPNGGDAIDPVPDFTVPAAITDKTISWSYNWPPVVSPPVVPAVYNASVNRITGLWTESFQQLRGPLTPNGSGGAHSGWCVAWKPPSYNPKF
jgi:hypothetical protein